VNGSTLTLGLVAGLAAVGAARRGSASRSDLQVVRGPSPLPYPRSGEVQRISLIDPDAGPALPNHGYFAPTTRKVTRSPTGRAYKAPKVETLPGALPGTVAFLDYHLLPGTGGAVYLDFYSVRPDFRGQGLGRRIIEEFYLQFADAPWIDWGEVVSREAQATWRRMKSDPGVPRTYGKVW
jgi:GNAT superfamily N-acetyltransferase